MPIALILDERISPTVADLLRASKVDGLSMQEWRDGEFLSTSDDTILAAAHGEGRTLVSFDLTSLPELLRQMVSVGTDHSGVVLVSQTTVKSNDFSGLAERLSQLAKDREPAEMLNTAIFL